MGESFFGPQAPGAGIRLLGYPRISSDALTRLPLLCNGALAYRTVFATARAPSKARQGRTAVAPHGGDANATDVVARRLR